MPPRGRNLIARAADHATPWDMAEGLGVIRKRKDRGTWIIDLRPVGRVQSHHGIPFTRKKDAERILSEIRGKAATKPLREVLAEYLPANAKPNRIPTKIAKWIKVKNGEAKAGNLSPEYVRALRRHAAPGGHFSFWDSYSIHELKYGLLEDWVAWLGSERKLAPPTQRNMVGEFRSFLSWPYRREEIPSIPPMRRVRVPEKRPRTLTWEKQAAVLEAIPEERRGAFLAMSFLGMRPNEARAVQVVDLEADVEGVWLVVRRSALGPAASSGIKEFTKNRRLPKRLPIRGALAEWIDEHVDPRSRLQSALLFPNPATGTMWGHEALRKTWRRGCKVAGCDVALYNGTKHTLGANLKREGVEDRLLQKLFGHAALESVRRYAPIADSSLVDVVDLLAHQREGGRKHSSSE